MRWTLPLVAIAFILPTAFAINPPDDSQWTLEAGRDGTLTATSAHAALSWTTTERSFMLHTLVVDDHQVLSGLSVPAGLEPTARGGTLRFVPPEPVHPPEPVQVRFWNNDQGLFQVGCIVPPEPVHNTNACMITFPEGHILEVTRSFRGHHEILVGMDEVSGIVPCVRILIDGDMTIDGASVSFLGTLKGKMVNPPDDSAPA